MVLKICEIVVNDVLEELNEENKRLLEELLFANKCLKVLNEFKNFVELNSNQFKLNLENNKRERYEELSENVNQVLNEKNNYWKNFNDNILVEVKREENSFDDNQRVVKTLKKRRRYKSYESTKKFVCDRPECQYKTNTKSGLQNHMKGHDNEVNDNSMNSFTNTDPMVEETNNFFCQYCTKCFINEHNLNIHLSTHLIDGQYVCHHYNCGQRFDDKRDLKNHRKRHTKRTEKKYICDFPGCDVAFDRPSRVEAHKILRHTEERHFECQTCGKAFATNTILKGHIRNMHTNFAEPVVCGIDDCDKQFRNEVYLKAHQKSCHLLRFFCNYPNCNYKTGIKPLLMKHKILNHTNDMPFKCQFDGCDKTFKLEEHYKYHLKTHSRTLLTCPYEGCGRTYLIDDSLRKHIQYNHTGTSFGCEWPGCEYRTNRKASLTNHMAKHGVPQIACIWPNCERMFKTKNNLKQHLLTHKQEKKQICPLPGCDYRCITAGSLRIHIKGRHKHI